jgi:hypothetical protein
MTDEEVNRTRSMCNPRLNKKTEHEETWHCSSLDGASEILRALLPQSKRALRRFRRIVGCSAFFGMLAPD